MTNSLDWSLLQAFVAVMRSGSLSAAAQTLRLTQPTVGRQIRTLEDQVGEALFDRTPQGLRPTDRAMALMEHAEHLEQAAQALSASITGKPESPTGTVRITTTEVFGVERLPALMRPFLLSNPGITIEVSTGMQVENLLRRDADIAIRFSRPEQPELIARQIGMVELGFFASEDYLARHGEPSGIDQVVAHAWVGFDRDAFGPRAAERLKLDVSRTHFAFKTDSLLAQREAIASGLGMGVLETRSARRAPGLRRLLAAEFAPRTAVWLVAHADVRQGRRYRAVFDHLAAVLPAEFRD
ncbi:LysR family transcriptional regulator [Falsiroseomonas stagni]|uniref:DNA-binding transcriptional regulator, LysR family n=1 Tax=Falsiroseomonas stagni DSM 19981 TaxID=1123062 RepID=A0A1I4CH06_9PROT|nr:LysR family transcriptional regulator [Falsiroseomonas stagni]SFK79396.1 DNA-binding transcriptional regulator, LysR family [Falsiroseomonas stagni DSM 19981]